MDAPAFQRLLDGGLLLKGGWDAQRLLTMLDSDDGVGTTAKLADAKPGLGTSIVAALANQLDATVTTENGEPGTKVSIVHDEPAS